MEIYIEGKRITSKDHPLIIQLTEQDKKNIANMGDGATFYAEFDDKDKTDPNEVGKMLCELKTKYGYIKG